MCKTKAVVIGTKKKIKSLNLTSTNLNIVCEKVEIDEFKYLAVHEKRTILFARYACGLGNPQPVLSYFAAHHSLVLLLLNGSHFVNRELKISKKLYSLSRTPECYDFLYFYYLLRLLRHESRFWSLC